MTPFMQPAPDEPGQYFTFKNPQPNAQYFAVEPTFHPPYGFKPIVDEMTGMCIGYSVAQAPGLWQIYDADGRFATLEESPLESPLIDPIDIALITLGAFRLLNTGRALLEAAASNRIRVVLSEATLNILRGRIKVGLAAGNLKFTRTTAMRMRDPGRYIPIQILERAIRYGSRSPDAQKIVGQFEYRIGMTRLTKRIVGNAIVYTPKKYTLHVLVREKDWTVMHFHIKEI